MRVWDAGITTAIRCTPQAINSERKRGRLYERMREGRDERRVGGGGEEEERRTRREEEDRRRRGGGGEEERRAHLEALTAVRRSSRGAMARAGGRGGPVTRAGRISGRPVGR